MYDNGRPLDSSPPADNPLILAILQALANLSPTALAGAVLALNALLDLPAEQRALLFRVLFPDWSDAAIAAAAGVHRTKLYTWASYKRLKWLLSQPRTLPTGTVDDYGNLEAWYENEAG